MRSAGDAYKAMFAALEEYEEADLMAALALMANPAPRPVRQRPRINRPLPISPKPTLNRIEAEVEWLDQTA